MLRTEALGVHLEELHRLLWMSTRHIVEGRGGDVVGLALADKRVVLEQILQLGLVALRLRMQDLLCLGPGIVSLSLSSGDWGEIL
jgi:hypothetical protein